MVEYQENKSNVKVTNVLTKVRKVLEVVELKNVNIIVYRQILKGKRGGFSLKEKEWDA